jgi:ABC-type sulfate/molybdate transport systems ATPase subunit
MLKVSGLTKSTPNRQILKDINFTVASGGRLAILGPSGSGKTSLLRLLAGLDRPAHGTIDLFGRKLSENEKILIPPEARELSLTFEEPLLFPHLSVLENVAFAIRDKSREERHSLATMWLSQFGVEPLAERFSESLSSGERQRVILARALAHSPRLLLLDEPFSHVDRLGRLALIKTLNKILEPLGLIVIFVTHDPNDVVELRAQSVLLLAGGQAQRQGTPQELRDVL